MTSKQPSNTSAQPDYSTPSFFVDRNIDSPDLCSFLAKAGLSIERHCDHFHPEAHDDEWIAAVCNQSWVILSADQNIEKHHLDVVVQGGAKLVLLIGKNSGAIDWAGSIVVVREQLFTLLRDHPGPLIIRVSKSGMITKIRHANEIEQRQKRTTTSKIARAKRHGQTGSKK